MSINVSLGTTKNKSESNSTTTVANVSEVKAGGDVNIVSTKKDIDIIGSNVAGENVKLDAKENLNISASKNTNKTEQNSKSSSASIGASISMEGTKYSVSGSASKGEVSANSTTYNESTVIANKDLSFASGNDTNIKGGILSGEKIIGTVGNDLNIESKQDSNNYKESNKSAGASIGLGSNKAVSGSASVGKIDSNYKSVTDQSGVYSSEGGFDIGVGKNTDLKGGMISSTAGADKNGWQDGDPEKNALHALVGGIMSELTGNGFLAGASASAINEMVQKKLSEQFAGEPDKHQWASAIIGGIVSQLVSGNAQAGASTAASGTKNNEYAKIDAENWYLIGDFIKNFKFDDWQEGEPVFAY